MDPLHDSAALAALADRLYARHDPGGTARLIVDQVGRLVPGADHVSLTLRHHGVNTTLAASDLVARDADDLQYALDEGPCVESTSTCRWIRSGEVGTDDRWPRWGPQARLLGVGAALSLDLPRGGRPQGAINIYSDASGGFHDRAGVDLARSYAAHAAHALASARLEMELHSAIGSRHVIGMAQGILIERFGLTQDSSFELLRRLSSSQEKKVRDVAQELVRSGRLPGS
ncbi:hypothetical protein QE364_001093 [Nocardioides zeae]|uniref:Uncharacterized protein n=1 Tax=Nocardioides zeae TaxID=1457234 RepID=A0ACC6IFG9_9ACTN|nr:GAF and ANTAR domain-containing protein [Nocardioides zeae]MDR6176380.1 hypothetical protein [Nocardioides zeae]MDR6209393.1 hypothetical protein [Nocardioides zeae]